MIAIRWGLFVFLGLLSWVLFDPLPPAFMWFVILMMMGSMSVHTVLHRTKGASLLVKQACRYAFFLSFPMLFVFAGNRMAVWSVAGETALQINKVDIPYVQSAIATEDYLLLKALQEEQFKDPTKAKKGFKKLLGKQLAKAKEMDKATRVILIVLGAILLLVIIFLVAIIVSVNQSANSCLGEDNSEGCL